MKILIADDSRVMRQIIKRTLRQAGFTGHQVVEAGDGREALELVTEETPDLVLADWNMPGMSGIELLGELRKRGLSVPFGFVTSEVSQAMQERGLQAGAQFVITKPFTPETFEQTLAPWGL